MILMTITYSPSIQAAAVVVTSGGTAVYYNGYGYRHGYYYGGRGGYARGHYYRGNGSYHHGTTYHNGNVYHHGGYHR